jgi:hypothetical protein
MRGWSWVLGGCALFALGAGIWLWTNPQHVGAPATPASEAVTRTPVAGPVAKLPQGGRELPVVEASLPEGSVPLVESTGTATLAGRVVVNGGPPGEQIELRFVSTQEEPSPESHGSFSTDVAGYFRHEGLPLDWEGSIRVPVPFRLANSADPFEYTRSVPLEHPREDLVIDVIRLPALRGRLLRADRTPAKGVGLDLRLSWSDGSRNDTGARADSEGRFAAEMEQDDLAHVSVEADADDGASCALEFARDALRASLRFGDLDMGDLFLSPGRYANLRVLDPQRSPVAGARVQTEGSNSRIHVETSSSGEALVPIGKEVTGLAILARGFAVERLPPPLDEVLVEVVLRHTNRLRVLMLDPTGMPLPEGRLRVSASRALFEGGLPYPDPFLRTGGSFFGTSGADGIYSVLVSGPDGLIELQELQPGLEFELSVVDRIGGVGAELACPGLGAEEQREVSLVLERFPQQLRGRCVDPASAPLEGAQVAIGGPNSCHETTGADGRFVSPPLFARAVNVSAELNGYGAAQIQDVDPSAGEVVLTLSAGRSLRVELRDTAGRAVKRGMLTARNPDGARSWRASSGGDGFLDFPTMPFEPLTLEYELYGRRLVKAIDADVEEVVFEVPALGLLEVEVGRLSSKLEEQFWLTARSLDDPQLDSGRRTVIPTGNQFVSWPLWSGRYELQLHSQRKLSPSEAAPMQPFGSPAVVVIEPGITTSARMGP